MELTLFSAAALQWLYVPGHRPGPGGRHRLLRFDPGCMVPQTSIGQSMLRAIESLDKTPLIDIAWEPGSLAGS